MPKSEAYEKSEQQLRLEQRNRDRIKKGRTPPSLSKKKGAKKWLQTRHRIRRRMLGG